MIQHLELLIIERINGFFGYRAVARLAIRQGPLPQRPRPGRRNCARSAGARSAALEHDLEAVKDPGLREALDRLGRAVIATSPRQNPFRLACQPQRNG